MRIETSFGFSVTVAEDAEEYLSDIETFEKLVLIDRGDWHPLPELVEALFGAEGRRQLYADLRAAKGRARTADVVRVIGEIIPKISEPAKK